MRTPSKKIVSFLLVTPFLLGFDVWTKDRARDIPAGESVEIVQGWLSFIHAENFDIAFSTPVPHPVIYAFTVIAVVVLAHMLWRLRADAALQAAAIGAIMAGAVGNNLIDRPVDGTVTDFIRFQVANPEIGRWLIDTLGTATWPIFNIADTAIFGGVSVFLIGSFFEEEPDPDGPGPETGESAA